MKNVVFITNMDLGNGRNTPYHYSVKSWKHWAKQYGHVVVELSEPLMDPTRMRPNLQRHWAFDVLDHNDIEYDQVLLVDADTIIHPGAPDFFQDTERKLVGVVNDGCYEWVNRSIEKWGDAMFPNEPKMPSWDYINTGFVIINKENHSEFMKEVQKFYLENVDEIQQLTKIIKAGTDQTILNYLIKQHKVETKWVQNIWNFQDLFRKNLLHIPNHSWFSDELHFLKSGWVYHFNAIPQNPRDVAYWMERTYRHFYE